jgi:hypothetical protein
MRHVFAPAALAALVLAAGGARAAEDSPGWDFSITPYLWLAGFHGNAGAVIDAPPTPVHVSFGDIFDSLSGFAMGKAEARYGHFGVVGNFDYISISGDHNATFGGILNASAKVKLSLQDSTLAGYYRFYDEDRYTADVFLGARYTDVTFKASVAVNARSISGEPEIDGWDPIIGVRGTMKTGRKGSVTGYADFGGGGFTDTTWQVSGSYDYRFNPHITGDLGLRVYGTTLSRSGNDYDLTAFGPVLGLTFRF